MVALDKDRYLEWAQEYAHTNTLFDAGRKLELLNITFFAGEWHALLRQQSAFAGLDTQALVPLRLVRAEDHRPLWMMNRGGPVTTFAADKFAEALRTKRGDRDLCTAAEEIGLSATQLMRLEKAGSTPGIDTFLLLCDWLGMRPATFLEDDRLYPVDKRTGALMEDVVQ